MQTQTRPTAFTTASFVFPWFREGGYDIRELTPADSGACEAFFNQLDPVDVGARYASRAFSHDYFLPKPVGKVEGMAFAAIDPVQGMLGVVNLAFLGPQSAEIAIIVRSDRKRHGIGRALMAHAVGWADAHRIAQIVAYASLGNHAALALLEPFGFAIPPAKSPYLEITRHALADRRGQGCGGESEPLAA